MTPEATLAEIYRLCQRHAHPGVNTGAHTLAAKIIHLIEELEGFDPDAMPAQGSLLDSEAQP